jgi:hypothetical protein
MENVSFTTFVPSFGWGRRSAASFGGAKFAAQGVAGDAANENQTETSQSAVDGFRNLTNRSNQIIISTTWICTKLVIIIAT